MVTKNNDIKLKIASIIATYFCVGNTKYAPGTLGSLATFPLFFIINYVLLLCGIKSFLLLAIIYFLVLVVLFILGFWSIDIYIKKTKKKDPSEVVFDEVIGQMIAFMLPMLLSIYYFSYIVNVLSFNFLSSLIMTFIIIIAPILFFRIFDILKPGLIGYFDENVDGATGIIMDDVIAGIYAGFSVGLILTLLFILLNFIQ